MTSIPRYPVFRFHLMSIAYLAPGIWCLVAALPLALGFISDWFYTGFTWNAFGLSVVACVVLAAFGGWHYYTAVTHRACVQEMPTRQRRVLRFGLRVTMLSALIGTVAAIPTVVFSILSAVVLVFCGRLLRLYRDDLHQQGDT